MQLKNSLLCVLLSLFDAFVGFRIILDGCWVCLRRDNSENVSGLWLAGFLCRHNVSKTFNTMWFLSSKLNTRAQLKFSNSEITN